MDVINHALTDKLSYGRLITMMMNVFVITLVNEVHKTWSPSMARDVILTFLGLVQHQDQQAA
ncbi:hypothetical protein [secondary endosymbiont of Ctenarytaina eucalypti]|uniref:hypothetical protein n=1 Tax=secondary endosymbiont of Ctenarytaina eucalypti TaxID=1199245 RepID=UPI0005C49E65|nr:hypothetical protein [secondary endosymbiont of Ctenarytaina eucalypti]